MNTNDKKGEKRDRISVGKGFQFNDYGINVALCLSDVPEKFIIERGGKKWLNLTLYKMKNALENKTHSLTVDTYIPKEKV